MSRLYILVRDDLKSTAYKAVQAGHAVAQFLLDYPESSWCNGTLVYAVVRDKVRLNVWKEKLTDNNIEYSVFTEPDIGNEETALAFTSNDFRFTNKLKLLGD